MDALRKQGKTIGRSAPPPCSKGGRRLSGGWQHSPTPCKCCAVAAAAAAQLGRCLLAGRVAGTPQNMAASSCWEADLFTRLSATLTRAYHSCGQHSTHTP